MTVLDRIRAIIAERAAQARAIIEAYPDPADKAKGGGAADHEAQASEGQG